MFSTEDLGREVLVDPSDLPFELAKHVTSPSPCERLDAQLEWKIRLVDESTYLSCLRLSGTCLACRLVVVLKRSLRLMLIFSPPDPFLA